jgi:hypothetical protein
MVYKPKKTVNGHKRNDRYTRSRKRARAARKRAASAPVRSNIKRYVADQLDKIAPDNRYYFNVTEASADKIKPICQSTTRIYPFGASFQKRFLNMEFRRMLSVVKQGLGQYPHLGAQENLIGLPTPAHTLALGASYQTDELHLRNTAGNYNNWRSVIGRGIHMKSSSVYGTITLFPNKDLTTVAGNSYLKDQLHTADLTLHMFVLEDKAVTKTAFMDWYQDVFDAKTSTGQHYTEVHQRIDAKLGSTAALTEDSWKGDMSFVPYRAGSSYVTNLPTDAAAPTSNSSNKFVASGTTATDSTKPGEYYPTSTGDEEFLIDWRKFYKHDASNKADELFHNTIPCTTSWDGSYDHSVLPINKSRFIVHEHKKWSFKPDSRGNVRQCIPWSYSFPEHYMTYEKQLLDLPFYYSKNKDSTDKQGIQTSLLFPRKQPYIVFCWSRCSSQGPTYVPNHDDKSGFKDSSNTDIGHQDVFHIDMNMKCHYENPLATKQVPTINKGKPLVHKRESRPRPKRPRGPAREIASLKKYTQPSMKDIWKVRRDAGTSSSKALSAQREAAIAKGKDIRAAMRRKEQEDHNSTLAEQGVTRPEFNYMAVEALNEVDDAGKDAFDMMMGGFFPYQGHGKFRSGITNIAFRSVLNAKVRAYISRKLSAAGLTADFMSIKQAAKAFYRYHQKIENDRVRASKTSHPQGRHTRLPEYIRR